MVMGAKRLGYGGETTWVENRGETTRGETTWGETSCVRNVVTTRAETTQGRNDTNQGQCWWELTGTKWLALSYLRRRSQLYLFYVNTNEKGLTGWLVVKSVAVLRKTCDLR